MSFGSLCFVACPGTYLDMRRGKRLAGEPNSKRNLVDLFMTDALNGMVRIFRQLLQVFHKNITDALKGDAVESASP